ncbi:hypothetical protein [Paenibacillus terrae]
MPRIEAGQSWTKAAAVLVEASALGESLRGARSTASALLPVRPYCQCLGKHCGGHPSLQRCVG